MLQMIFAKISKLKPVLPMKAICVVAVLLAMCMTGQFCFSGAAALVARNWSPGETVEPVGDTRNGCES